MSVLYHYTSIDTLELILRNKTIRFNRMDRVDDRQESELISQEFWSKYLFVSSWTKNPFESHDLWHYAGLNGVKIGLPEYPFKKYQLQSGTTSNITFGESTFSYVPLQKLVTQDFQFFLVPYENWFMGGAIEYSSEPGKQKPPFAQDSNGDYHFHLDKLARIKDIYWAGQQEFRYVLFILPAPSLPLPPLNNFRTEVDFYRLLAHYYKCLTSAAAPVIEFFDLELSQELETISVTLGPSCSEQEKQRVKDLLQTYAPAGSVCESRVSGKIRKPIRE